MQDKHGTSRPGQSRVLYEQIYSTPVQMHELLCVRHMVCHTQDKAGSREHDAKQYTAAWLCQPEYLEVKTHQPRAYSSPLKGLGNRRSYPPPAQEARPVSDIPSAHSSSSCSGGPLAGQLYHQQPELMCVEHGSLLVGLQGSHGLGAGCRLAARRRNACGEKARKSLQVVHAMGLSSNP